MIVDTLLVAVLLTGGADAGPAEAAPDTAARNDIGWFVAPLDTVDSFVVVPEVEANLETTRAWMVGLEWPFRPFDVAMQAVGEIVGGRAHMSLDRSGLEAVLVVEQLRLEDDSVGGRRDEVRLAHQVDGTWRVILHRRSFFCPRGPGRGAWIAGPCH